MHALTLQRARPEHIDRLIPLVEAYHAFEEIDLAPERRREALTRLLSEPHLGHVWFAVEGSDTLGYVALCYGFSIEFAGVDAFVDELFLVDHARGRGFGARVMELLTEEARRRGVVALHLEVDRQNRRARNLYERYGFEMRDHFSLMTRRT